jgi:Laminin G domain
MAELHTLKDNNFQCFSSSAWKHKRVNDNELMSALTDERRRPNAGKRYHTMSDKVTSLLLINKHSNTIINDDDNNNNNNNNTSSVVNDKCKYSKKYTSKLHSPSPIALSCCKSTSRKSSINLLTFALLLLIGLLFKINPCYGFVLDGSQNSYAQFRKWYTGLNGTLELEFKTEQPNGLVLYTDDGGTYDFFELKLVEGALRLRYNLGGGAQIITVGRDLHDGHWHKVQVCYNLF